MKKVIIATRNPGKAREFSALFQPLGYTAETLIDHPEIPDVDETGTTFVENATLKATAVAKALHCPVLADDSGLSVDALDGRPGVYSARYAGLEKDTAKNNQKLLDELAGIPDNERTAHYTCVLVISNADGKRVKTYEATWEGTILTAPRGENGFGYDPLFYVPEYKKTAAELEPSVKDAISHRGRAIQQLADDLKKGAFAE
ncbi:MAG: XTP/dITP diphosphatase [Aerococcus sp.]|nr:XTP/dITP diphosphatase [Aerococcus sp.]